MITMTREPSPEELWVARDRLVTEMARDREEFFPARMAQIVELRLINQAIDQLYSREA